MIMVKQATMERKGKTTMFVRWLLFETKMGEMLLAFLERKAGLVVVSAEWLAGQRSSKPVADSRH
jgi:hypothetical protein